MARSQSYRDIYDGRGNYAQQYDAMLVSECLRTDAWKNESTQYKRSVVWPALLALVFSIAIASIVLFALANNH